MVCESDTHSGILKKQLSTFYNDAHFVDVLIECGDQSRFKAHAVVLAAYSEVLFDLLQKTKCNDQGLHHLNMVSFNIHPWVMEQLLLYLYTGHIDQNIFQDEDFISAAKILKISQFEKLSKEQLEHVDIKCETDVSVSPQHLMKQDAFQVLDFKLTCPLNTHIRTSEDEDDVEDCFSNVTEDLVNTSEVDTRSHRKTRSSSKKETIKSNRFERKLQNTEAHLEKIDYNSHVDNSYSSSRKYLHHKCNYCGKEYGVKKTFESHLSGHKYDSHANKPNSKSGHMAFWFERNGYKCNICASVIDNTRAFSNHLKWHATLNCPVCMDSFKSTKEMYKHILKHDVNIVCHHCNRLFFTSLQCAHHELTHTKVSSDGVDENTPEVPPKQSDNIQSNTLDCSTKKYKKKKMVSEKKKNSGVLWQKCTICTKTFPSNEEMGIHYKTYHQSNKCSECNQLFGTIGSLQKHILLREGCKASASPALAKIIQTSSGIKKYQCAKCDKSYMTLYKLKIHMRNHTGERPFQCLICNKYFISSTTCQSHMLVHSKSKPFPCSHCEKGYTSRCKLWSHVKKHHFPPDIQCPACEQGFASGDEMHKHVASEHKELKPEKKCMQCLEEFYTTTELEFHMKNHFEKKRLNCLLCPRTFEQPWRLQQHQNQHTGDRPYACSVCKKSFFRSDILKSHMHLHESKPQFKCSVCDKLFRHRYRLGIHMRIHTKLKPFICTYCGKSFRHEDTCKYHTMRHTGQRPHQCRICGKAYIQDALLKIHMRKHTGERPFLCPTCGASFASQSSLYSHLHTHLTDKKFSCDICSKTFHRRNVMLGHKLAVHGSKRFVCKFCGKGFTRKVPLVDHERIHTGEKPHSCKYCSKTFARTSTLFRHTKRHTNNIGHSNTPDGTTLQTPSISSTNQSEVQVSLPSVDHTRFVQGIEQPMPHVVQQHAAPMYTEPNITTASAMPWGYIDNQLL